MQHMSNNWLMYYDGIESWKKNNLQKTITALMK